MPAKKRIIKQKDDLYQKRPKIVWGFEVQKINPKAFKMMVIFFSLQVHSSGTSIDQLDKHCLNLQKDVVGSGN